MKPSQLKRWDVFENTTGSLCMVIHKGVSYIKSRKKFKSEIRYKSKGMHLGMFNSEIEAAKAYDEAAKKYFKEFAYLNFKDNEK